MNKAIEHWLMRTMLEELKEHGKVTQKQYENCLLYTSGGLLCPYHLPGGPSVPVYCYPMPVYWILSLAAGPDRAGSIPGGGHCHPPCHL